MASVFAVYASCTYLFVLRKTRYLPVTNLSRTGFAPVGLQYKVYSLAGGPPYRGVLAPRSLRDPISVALLLSVNGVRYSAVTDLH